MVSTIEKFSSCLGVMYCMGGRFDLDPVAFDEPESIADIFQGINFIYNLYKREFESVVLKILENDEEEFFEFFVKAILSRSVRLSENSSYFHFMLVCTLIREVVYEAFDIYGCYVFAELGSQSLKATYERCYKAKFSNTTDFYGDLLSYCRNFLLEGCDGKKLLQETYRQDISTLIESLEDIDDVNFQLTDMEKNRLEQTMELIYGDYFRTNKSFEIEHAGEDNSEPDDDSCCSSSSTNKLFESERVEEEKSMTDGDPLPGCSSSDEEDCKICEGDCLIIIYKLAKCKSFV